MKIQKSAEAINEPKKEDLSKFKKEGTLKRIKSRIRNRAMPLLISSLIAVSPALKHHEIYAQDSLSQIEQIKKENPTISKEDALIHILYVNHSDAKKKISKGAKEMVEEISGLIEKNKENRIFCIALNSVITNIFNKENNESISYIDVDDLGVTLNNKMNDPTKVMTMVPYGKNGVSFSVLDMDSDNGKCMTIDTNSTGENVNTLRTEMSKFMGNPLPEIIMINNELEENKKK
jgi:hypothetical protein